MKAKELRIGNLVNVDEKAYKISGGDIYNLENYSKNYGHLYKPIPLTEEWLEKFGFMQPDSNYLIWEKQGFKPFCILFEALINHWQIGVYGGRVFKRIKYVHQLQNLYFALTGEEL